MKQLILASSSPRRKELLELAQLPFIISTSSISEEVDQTLTPAQAVETLAKQKAQDVFRQYQDCTVIGADTIVAVDNQILGKPNSKVEAKKILTSLSGRTHDVFTGVAIISSERSFVFHERTSVSFYELDSFDIDQYIESGEPFDKAGAYGIQGLGSLFVKEIHGDYFNVVGLPIARTVRELRSMTQM